MGSDKSHMEPADKKSVGEEHVRPVTKCLRQGLPYRLITFQTLGLASSRVRGQRHGQDRHEKADAARM